jgi:geranylgeranyl pyrophosphate synthase
VKGGRRAVLLGDLIFATALHRSAEAGRKHVLVLAKAIARVATGAYREPLDSRETHALLRQQPRRGGVYEHLIQTKTGALFAAAAELGAVAAAAPPVLCAAAADFGARLGEAYQMADDLADLVGPSKAAARSPQQAAALAVLVAYLKEAVPEPATAATVVDLAGSAAGVSIDPLAAAGSSDPRDLATLLRGQIKRRVSLARQAIKPFPEGPRVGFLESLPEALVSPAAAGSR